MRQAIGLIFIATAASIAPGQAWSQNAGPIISRSYPVRGFDRVEAAGPYDVVIRTGAGPSVSASGPQALMQRMIVEVRGGELKIHPRREQRSFRWNSRSRVRVTVTVPQLRGAELAGSGDMRIDQVRGPSFDGSVAGSGNLLLGGVDVGSFKLSVAGSGDARAGRGRAQNVDISVAGSGDADTRGIASPTASISVAGSGRVSAYANRAANVSVIGSGDVEVIGGARCTVSRMGSGKVRCS